MAGINRVMLLGRLGQDPQLKNTANGMAICSFTLVTSEKWTKDGEQHEKTEWSSIVAFGKLADLCSKYLSKGKQCFVEGKLSTRSWDDEKTGQKRYKTEIVANNVQFLGGSERQTEINDPPAAIDPVLFADDIGAKIAALPNEANKLGIDEDEKIPF